MSYRFFGFTSGRVEGNDDDPHRDAVLKPVARFSLSGTLSVRKGLFFCFGSIPFWETGRTKSEEEGRRINVLCLHYWSPRRRWYTGTPPVHIDTVSSFCL